MTFLLSVIWCYCLLALLGQEVRHELASPLEERTVRSHSVRGQLEQGLQRRNHKLGGAHTTCHFSSLEVEAGDTEFKASLAYLARYYFKRKKFRFFFTFVFRMKVSTAAALSGVQWRSLWGKLTALYISALRQLQTAIKFLSWQRYAAVQKGLIMAECRNFSGCRQLLRNFTIFC